MLQFVAAEDARDDHSMFEAEQVLDFVAANDTGSIAASGVAPKRRSVEHFFFISDLVALSLSFAVGGLISAGLDRYLLGIPFDTVSLASVVEAFAAFLCTGLVALLWLDTKGHYNHRLPFWEANSHILGLALVGIGVGGFVQFSAKSEYSRLWLGLSWISFAVMLYVGRVVVRRWLEKTGQWAMPTLVIGEGAGADAALKAFESEQQLGYRILDVVPSSILDDLTTRGAWTRFMEQTGARHVLLSIPDYKVEYYNVALQNLVYERVSYSIVPTWFSLPMSTLSSHYFFTQGVTVMHNTNRLELMLPRLIKRSFDIVAAGGALVALSPLFALMVMMVKRDGGKAFFGHSRVGHQGREFKCLKFRSMVPNSADVLKQHLEANPAAREEWQKEMKLKNDPRVTGIGKILRRTSLDELPQLINVLRGDMSLVGPRPIVTEECARYDNDIALYYMVRPGLTGLWQVSGRNDVSYKTRVKMDSLYISNWSLWHDIAIILKTFPVIFNRTGAY